VGLSDSFKDNIMYFISRDFDYKSFVLGGTTNKQAAYDLAEERAGKKLVWELSEKGVKAKEGLFVYRIEEVTS
jgi:hypothetical protein